MTTPSPVREWARMALAVELPTTFEELFEATRSRLPKESQDDFESLVMIEMAGSRARDQAMAIDEQSIKRLLWRVRKRIQRQRDTVTLHPRSLDYIQHSVRAGGEEIPREVLRQRLRDLAHDLESDEFVILAMMIDGADARLIQSQLSISRATYYRRVRSIREKLLRQSG